MRSHRDLRTWQAGRRLVAEIYRATESFPDEEKFGLVAQLRRAAVSVPSNIAEGSGRSSTADYLRFLYQARASLNEIDTQIVLASDLGYIEDGAAEDLISELEDFANLLQGQINSLEEKVE